jgi:3'-phosphoadenosine 5'-phosphosulfate sulfotransferase (PAPS reductase)/FAD synthetase
MRDKKPDLASFDKILVSSSGGKDSQAMLDYVVELAREAGVLDRVCVVHADLGRVEWLGTKELVLEHAAHYGLPVHVVAKAEYDGDLLNYVEARAAKLADEGRVDKKGAPARAWPMVGMCNGTSDFKTAQIAKLVTKFAKELKKELGRTPRVLDCVGLAKHESSGRDKRLSKLEAEHGYAFKVVKDNRNQYFAKWYPLANWSEEQVWERIEQAGTRYHFAYDLGMSRLSCAFCIAASDKDLRIAAEHNSELAKEYLRVEKVAGSFKATKSLAEIVGAVVEANEGRPATVQEHNSLATKRDGKVFLKVA